MPSEDFALITHRAVALLTLQGDFPRVRKPPTSFSLLNSQASSIASPGDTGWFWGQEQFLSPVPSLTTGRISSNWLTFKPQFPHLLSVVPASRGFLIKDNNHESTSHSLSHVVGAYGMLM